MKELEILLEKFWIIKEKEKELYYQIKDATPKFKDFLEEKLGYKLIINPYMIKLEKLPGKPEPWMGIEDFDNSMEYAFLCLLLVFLEDKSAEEQFVLSEVTEFIQASFSGEQKVDWTLFQHRRSMVKMLRFAAAIGIIQANDGEEGSFMSSMETEVLYESTGLSRYFVRNFTGNILNYSSYQDIEKGEWLDMDRDRGRVRRNRVYRRLVMAPAVYSEGPEDQDYLYIKNQRGILQKDMETFLGSSLHIHKNATFLILDQSKNFKDVFPGRRNISDVVLLVNTGILDMVESGELKPSHDDTIVVSKVGFEKIVENIQNRSRSGWSKKYREMQLHKLCAEVIPYMKGFQMIEITESKKEIKILPLVGKLTGKYPKDYQPNTGKRQGK